MRWRTFFFYNALGGMLWAAAAVMVGYLLSGSLDLVEWWAGRASLLLLGLVLLGLAFYLSYRWLASRHQM
jgi:membrane protein DedA with SNARE-associated domain